ncbi:MAG: sugar phosphate isomerase/epimerase family protein [Clostridia bacterium]
MKLAYSVPTPDSNVPLLAFCGDFKEDVKIIKELGYDGIELLVRNPRELSIVEITKVIERHNLQVAAVGTSPMQAQDKLTLLNSDSKVMEEALTRTKSLVEFASNFNAPVCIGKFRGNVQANGSCTLAALSEIFTEICAHAQKHHVQVLLEPQNNDNVNNLNSVEESLNWIAQIKCDNLGLLLDTYHMEFTEHSIAAGFLKAKDKIGFIHASDSKRLVPGAGRINFADVLATLNTIHYDNFISLEIKQKPDSKTVAKISHDMLRYVNQLK